MRSKRDCEESWRQGLLRQSESDPNPIHRANIQKVNQAGLCVEITDPRFKAVKPPPWHFD